MKKVLYSFPGKAAALFLFALLAAFGAVEIFYAMICRYSIPLGFIASEYGTDSGIYLYWKQMTASAGLREWIGAGLLLAALCTLVLLCCMAGRRFGCEDVRLSRFDRIPFELLLLPPVAAVSPLFKSSYLAVGRISDSIMMLDNGLGQFDLLLLAVSAGGAAVLGLLLYTLAARLKAGAFWRHTLVGQALRLLWRVLCWLGRLLSTVPLVWRSTLICTGIWLAVLLLYLAPQSGGIFCVFLLFGLCCTLGCILFCGQLRKLQTGVKRLAAGDMDAVVDAKGMIPDCRECAEHLNHIQEGMNEAVEQRLRSERFRTELITNVSHDLKTPLTSIISYVDLLKGLSLPDETAQEYVEVLDRQAKRLGKLTADLIDASKASSGSMEVQLAPTDVAELARQSLGEYEERLTNAGLTVVAQLPEQPAVFSADGRLLWRVLDNLLSNVCKYALRGTRVYVRLEGNCLTVRNISRDPLTLTPEELEERFVRGDASRSTEGSGLGLSIASSLLQLMGGRLELTVDGDLFKASVLLAPNLQH